MKNYIIAIDPGKNGGITALYGDKIIDISKMPPNPEALYEHFLYLGLPNNYKGNLSLNIENVHSMPTDGSKASFSFGRGLGQIEGVLATMSLLGALKRISPHTWMSYFDITRKKGETKTNFKNRLKKLAVEKSNMKLTLATCDSYLLALYAKEKEWKEYIEAVREKTTSMKNWLDIPASEKYGEKEKQRKSKIKKEGKK